MKPRLAVIQFPGSNCEYETRRAAEYYGFDASIVRWNDSGDWSQFDAFILPGGFSYQDRVRAGAISAKLPVMAQIAVAASQGVPVLGICNGCQILAESGLISGASDTVNVGMSPNMKDGKPVGFICDWKYVRAENPEKSVFTRYFDSTDVLPIPINHGEGRFVLDPGTAQSLGQIATFRYCDENGVISSEYPINPNGAAHSIAGISNFAGNVMGVMPHPERAAFLKQVPGAISGPWKGKKHSLFNGGADGVGPFEKLFVSMRDSAKGRG